MEILRIKENAEAEVVAQTVKTLEQGGIVIYPTETCYGVAADATNQSAVDKLLKYKARWEGKPLSVGVTGKEMAAKYVEINEVAENIYDNYLPGPITVVSKGLNKVAKGVQSEFGTLGVRVPDYGLVLKIIQSFGKPITATSANVSYKKTPYSVADILENITKKQEDLIDLILDAGELPKAEPSTVVDTTLNNLNVMRQGSVKFNENLTDEKLVLEATTNSAEETAQFGERVMLKYTGVLNNKALLLGLKGELGAGKTQFVKGIAKTLKINDQISSPTFTIIDEYPYSSAGYSGFLLHMDTWRVDGVEEFKRTGLKDYLKAGNVIAIEWADKFWGEIKKMVGDELEVVLVEFEHISEEERKIKVFKI